MTGLEPAPSCLEQILNLPRLPFRHIGAANLLLQRTSILAL